MKATILIVPPGLGPGTGSADYLAVQAEWWGHSGGDFWYHHTERNQPTTNNQQPTTNNEWLIAES